MATAEGDPTDAPAAATLTLGLAVAAGTQRVPVATRRDGSGLAASRAHRSRRGVARNAQRLAVLGAGVHRPPSATHDAVLPSAGVASRASRAQGATVAGTSLRRSYATATGAGFRTILPDTVSASGLAVGGPSVNGLVAATVDTLCCVAPPPAAAADPLISPTGAGQLGGPPACGAPRDDQHRRAGGHQRRDQCADDLGRAGVAIGQRIGMLQEISGEAGTRPGRCGHPLDDVGREVGRQGGVGCGHDGNHAVESLLLSPRGDWSCQVLLMCRGRSSPGSDASPSRRPTPGRGPCCRRRGGSASRPRRRPAPRGHPGYSPGRRTARRARAGSAAPGCR